MCAESVSPWWEFNCSYEMMKLLPPRCSIGTCSRVGDDVAAYVAQLQPARHSTIDPRCTTAAPSSICTCQVGIACRLVSRVLLISSNFSVRIARTIASRSTWLDFTCWWRGPTVPSRRKISIGLCLLRPAPTSPSTVEEVLKKAAT